MPPLQIRAIEFPSLSHGAPKTGMVDVELRLADGTSSKFSAATLDQPQKWLEKNGKGYAFGDPVLFVNGLGPKALREAAQTLAKDLGGYWLRYYNSQRRARVGKTAKPGKVSQCSIAQDGTPGSGVVQVTIDDGRIFSILAATPARFKSALEEASLRFYFGPSVLFLRDLDTGLAQRAVSEMASKGDLWLCLYDTPRTTISNILSDFKKRHS